ncbi:hypothetical protein LWI29_011231 [Acer saccharum]|uniref:Uncharacterized protein n=1 Tax=Acer saccharum TaxID=4024 RepID=A0AA39RVV1_ACESA|nr:hypothetical protein LWI29_011231 [Acer saccharum]
MLGGGVWVILESSLGCLKVWLGSLAFADAKTSVLGHWILLANHKFGSVGPGLMVLTEYLWRSNTIWGRILIRSRWCGIRGFSRYKPSFSSLDLPLSLSSLKYCRRLTSELSGCCSVAVSHSVNVVVSLSVDKLSYKEQEDSLKSRLVD